MAGVLARECSDKISYKKQDKKADMRGEDGVCSGSISNLALYIPLDLTIEILKRLPAKSLQRFQCVSKIQNQVFIDSFCSMSQARSRFLVAVRITENRVILLSTSHNETEVPTTSLVTNLPMPIRGCRLNPIRYTSLHTYPEMTLSGFPVDLVHCSSIHGLFGLSHPSDPGRFTICNPSTRQVITLPDIKASSGRREHIYMFLGYDPVGNVYKALCSTSWYGQPCQEHMVLTIGGGNLSWRSIKGRKIPRYTVVTNGICINGMVYYGVSTTRRQEKRLFIFRFNVRGECIGSINTYWPVIKHGSLINFNGRVAGVRPLPRDLPGSFDLWILDDFDKKRHWYRKGLTVHPLLLHLSGNIELKILGMNKSYEVVIGPLKFPPKHEPLYIYYYNIRGVKLFRRVELKGFEEFGCNHTSEEQCVCQVLFSPEHFESLMSL
ncbi:PREDICTED: F-box protein At1g30790-like [Camelina sativa]|uniref:F-box protein At1g30790-like n=1 Tax=Camelina sativa TaxID=90675 RepID=A0ABM0XEN3_CAMSA|nr:PREDICTED: F-box protein At1g30790-like [Camelina sativa]